MRKRILETLRPTESQGAINAAAESQHAAPAVAEPAAAEPPAESAAVFKPAAANRQRKEMKISSKCKRGGGISLSPTAVNKMKNDKVVYKGSTSRKPSPDEHQSMTPMNPAELAIYWSELVKEVDITTNGLMEAREKRSKEGDGNKKGDKKGRKK
ncbi:hypothetical protein RIF29_19048 [Crotalaria pallida]|uniref:Uncharacterized protein n=1 Tax=Crotalaria pallida TaxID=3830 RepID=A0AAN9F0L7_CROPI